ncbi:hypothetical protein NHF46_10075 [Arthrobacter alpinus]|nr:hypothetical protein [Arthrobacter alpinus]
MTLPAILVASMALIFTVASFWWLNARPGRLIIFSVMTFAGYITTQRLTIQVPVVVHNTGAKPRVIRALRLQGVDQSGKLFQIEAQTFQMKLEPSNDGMDFAHAFAVSGRSVVTKYVRFSTVDVPQLVPGASTKLVLQGLVDERDRWVGLKTLDIFVGILISSFITMSNNPDHWDSMTLQEGREHQEVVMKVLRERPAQSSP